MHEQVAVKPVATALPAGASLAYIAQQAFLWLAVPLALYVVFISQIPAIHNAAHATRHGAGWFMCH